MSLIVTLTGSYPPVRKSPPYLTEHEVRDSIQNAITQQNVAIGDKSINWLFVDGQPRSDIVGIFAPGLGLLGEGLPYRINNEIKHLKPITLEDLAIATEAVGEKPLKAHVTGPTLMADSCEMTTDTPIRYRDDPNYPRQLVLDFANALAQEIKLILEAPNLSIAYLQIDEPTFESGANLELANEALDIMTQVARSANIPTILHVCGDTSGIMESLLKMPVEVLNIESKYLREVPWLDANLLVQNNKKVAIGCIPVNVDEVPSARWLERELLLAGERYGFENIWGITPACGLRMSTSQFAKACLSRLTEVADKIAPRFKQQGEEKRR